MPAFSNRCVGTWAEHIHSARPYLTIPGINRPHTILREQNKQKRSNPREHTFHVTLKKLEVGNWKEVLLMGMGYCLMKGRGQLWNTDAICRSRAWYRLLKSSCLYACVCIYALFVCTCVSMHACIFLLVKYTMV